MSSGRNYDNGPKCWLNFRKSQDTEPTIREIGQPNSEKYEAVASMPMVTDGFGKL